MEQFLAFYEEQERGAVPGAPNYLFLPVRAGLRPKFTPDDVPRKEFRGAPTALGDSSVVRRESSWSHEPQTNFYPGKETGCLLKHLLGNAGPRTLVDVSAYRGMIYPTAMPYGAGSPLGESALAMVPHTDEEGVTRSQVYGGGRVRSGSFAITPPEEVTLALELGGAGPWVGAPDQASVGVPNFPAAAPFLFGDVTCYIGAGAVRTGSAPNYTDLAPGTMTKFSPDNINIKITPGMEDVTIINGVKGPSHTRRTAQFLVEVDFTIDYRDPVSGFSSADEFKATFSGPRTNSLMIVMDSGILAGDESATFRTVIDLPLMLATVEPPEDSSEGAAPMQNFAFKSLYSPVTKYPIGILTVDKADSYSLF